ncbi:hypothetical protein Golob_017115, partial [Gossypium lobatum]|nr:hypothetical protein [Gossypium lobatum]
MKRAISLQPYLLTRSKIKTGGLGIARLSLNSLPPRIAMFPLMTTKAFPVLLSPPSNASTTRTSSYSLWGLSSSFQSRRLNQSPTMDT